MILDRFKVGDLVVLKQDKIPSSMDYALWVGPDYEDSSWEVKSVINPIDVMIVLNLESHNNVFLMLSNGTVGWSKINCLKKA